MIIKKDNSEYLSRPDKPNENWTDEIEVFVVNNNSELAQRIINSYPHYEFILDGDGQLIDILPTERPPEPPPEPTETELLSEYIVDVDFRIAMLELGL